MRLEWNSLSVKLYNENENMNEKYINVLSGISGNVETGEVLGIMGLSGSGKSTLLKALCCRTEHKARTNGQLSLDGKHINLKEHIENVVYISSDEKSFLDLTIDEIINNTATFKMPKTSRRDISERSNFYKTKLHLHDISGTKFYKLTASERKRMFIAASLMTEAKILCVDEPIGEMDSLTAFDVMQTLKYVAQTEGKIVVVTVDLPNTNIFNLFDKLQVLYQGKSAYFGPASECANVFTTFGFERVEKTSDPEYILDIFYKNAGYNEEGKYDAHLQKLVENYTNPPLDEKNVMKSNNAPLDYSVDMNDIKRLLKRRYRGAYTGKLAFLKAFYLRFLFITLAIITLFTIINKRLDNPVQFLPGSKNFSHELQNDSTIINAAKAYQGTYLVALVPCILAFFSLYSLVTVFGSESEVVRGEITAGFYSVTSYYISVIYYELVMHSLIPILMVTVVMFAFFSLISINVLAVFILSMLFFAPIVLFIGSLSFKRKTTLLLASFLILITIIPPTFVFEQIGRFDPKGEYKINYFKTVYLMVPFTYFTSLLNYRSIYNVKKILGSKIDEEPLKILKNMINFKLRNSLPMFFGYKVSYYLLILLLFLLTPVFCLATIYILGLKLRPEMRSKFAKNLATKPISEIHEDAIEVKSEIKPDKTESPKSYDAKEGDVNEKASFGSKLEE